MNLRFIWLLIATSILFPSSVSAANLYWYLAASMTKPGKEIVETFNRGNNPFTVILITGGSGQLLSKISMAGKGDLYTPAGLSYVEKAKELNLLQSYQPLIVQTPVFALSTRGKQKIRTWDDLGHKGIRIGLGNPKTMALGHAYLQIKERMGTELAAKFSRNTVVKTVNVSQIINYLRSGIIDAGISFDSTAKANALSYIDIPKAYNQPETAPLIILNSESNKENTILFTDFISSNFKVFVKYGFQPAEPQL